MRQHWLAEFTVSMREAREFGLPGFEIALLGTQEILGAVAQRAPLQMGTTQPENGLGWHAWAAWRVAGPLALLGYVMQSGWALLAGGAALLFAFAMLAWFAREEPMPKLRARTTNGVLGGLVCVIAILLVPGVIALGAVLAALAFGQTWIAVAAVHLLTIVAVVSLAAITASGWVPGPWQPKRLVRV